MQIKIEKVIQLGGLIGFFRGHKNPIERCITENSRTGWRVKQIFEKNDFDLGFFILHITFLFFSAGLITCRRSTFILFEKETNQGDHSTY